MKGFAVFLTVLFGLFISLFFFRDVIAAQTTNIVAYSPCKEPKRYSIGRIDPRFGLTKEEVTSAIEEAEHVWENSYGDQLFVYDHESPFTINFIYDTRQSLNTEINEKNADIKEKDQALKPRIDAYNKRSLEIQDQVKKLNAEIETWNSQGGAPDDVFARLKQEQDRLRAELAALHAEADQLSLTTDELQDEAESLEETVTTFNNALHDKPEGGKYILDQDGERIDIAIFDTRQELINVLSHELGHAIGMDHVNDKNAVMYSRTNDSVTVTEDDLEMLQFACRERNLLKQRLDDFRSNFMTRLRGFISFEVSE